MDQTTAQPNVVPKGTRYRGPIEPEVYDITEAAWASPFTVQSDYARAAAYWVGFAASLGWITTIGLDGTSVGRTWHITARGAQAIQGRSPEECPSTLP